MGESLDTCKKCAQHTKSMQSMLGESGGMHPLKNKCYEIESGGSFEVNTVFQLAYIIIHS